MNDDKPMVTIDGERLPCTVRVRVGEDHPLSILAEHKDRAVALDLGYDEVDFVRAALGVAKSEEDADEADLQRLLKVRDHLRGLDETGDISDQALAAVAFVALLGRPLGDW